MVADLARGRESGSGAQIGEERAVRFAVAAHGDQNPDGRSDDQDHGRGIHDADRRDRHRALRWYRVRRGMAGDREAEPGEQVLGNRPCTAGDLSDELGEEAERERQNQRGRDEDRDRFPEHPLVHDRYLQRLGNRGGGCEPGIARTSPQRVESQRSSLERGIERDHLHSPHVIPKPIRDAERGSG